MRLIGAGPSVWINSIVSRMNPDARRGARVLERIQQHARNSIYFNESDYACTTRTSRALGRIHSSTSSNMGSGRAGFRSRTSGSPIFLARRRPDTTFLKRNFYDQERVANAGKIASFAESHRVAVFVHSQANYYIHFMASILARVFRAWVSRASCSTSVMSIEET